MSSPYLQAGSSLGRYRLLEQIGSGGMGVVFRAHDEKLRREVAIKIIKPGLLDERARALFQREALALSQLSHPAIQTIFDFDTEGEMDYLVVEYIPGKSLDELVAKGPLTRERVIALGIQLASALGAAHEKGILHRDLKPSNLRVTPDGHLKVLDFGLAKFYEAVHTDDTRSVGTGLVGTPQYMAAELLLGEPASVASDIYGAGVVLYELATGSRPFSGSLGELVPKVLSSRVPPPSSLNANISGGLDDVILKAMNREPGKRYATAKELRTDLESFTESSQRPVARPGTSLPWGAIACGILLLLAVSASGWIYRHRTSKSTAHGIHALAVLPLENISGESSMDYLAVALTDQLTSELASLPTLKVISRASASHYANSKLSSQEIAKKLGVDALIGGTVLKSDKTFRISVEMIDGESDQHLWSRVYERNATEVIEVQKEIAQTVAKQIHLKLAGEEPTQPGGTTNPEAYDAFLRARYKVQGALDSRQDADAALQLARKAVQLDPRFADAYVTLAEACQALIFGHGGGKEYDEEASVALDKALQLDPKLATAYQARGFLAYSPLRGFQIAETIADYRKALAINPNLASAHHWLGGELAHAGFHDEAVAELKKSLELDPESDGAKFRMARALMQANRFEESVQTYLRYGIADLELGVSYAYLGNYDEALRVEDEVDRRATPRELGSNPSGRNVTPTSSRNAVAGKALVYALQGKKPEAIKQIEVGLRQNNGPHFHHTALVIGAAYAELGMKHDAVKMLKFCADNGMPNYPIFRDNPSLKKLAGYPEYDQFMANLKPRWEQLRVVVAAP